MRGVLLILLFALTGCATVPAYTWATFDRTSITKSGARGDADRARRRRLTIDDPARIASVTKLVVALGALRMVEAGQLDLDRDISDYLGWPLRNPVFPDRPITLRMLLSHTGSLRDDVDYAVPLGTSLRTALADPRAFDAAHPPGTYFRYANLGFPVIASVMERASGERFDELMARLVLAPLGLDACFNWTTCSHSDLRRAVVLYDGDGRPVRDDLGGVPPACPVLAPEGVACDLAAYEPGSNGALFSPQGGLRISVRDLTVIGRLLLNRGRPLIGEASFAMLTTPAWTYDGANGDTESGFHCRYALAVQVLPTRREGCRDDLAGRALIGHSGDAYGLRSGLWVDMERGTGIAYLATGNADDPPRGRSAFRKIEERLARNLGR